MGRPRKPDHLKLVSGTFQPSRSIGGAPKPARKRPEPPPHLGPDERMAWGEAVAMADRLGVLTEADMVGLEVLACAMADARRARKAIIERDCSPTYACVTKGGSVMWRAYPEVAIAADADRRVQAWAAKFGLSPADRARVSAAATDDTGPADSFEDF